MSSAVSVPGIVNIKASQVAPPPVWALMERDLIDLMTESAEMYARKYTERGGGTLLAEDLDDLYEQFYNYGLFYAIGADDNLLDLHLREWNASTRISDDTIVHRAKHNDHKKVFSRSVHNEFWNMDQAAEWHHLGEGSMAFYDFGVADPTISENVRRAKRFAAMFIGEDPEAPNYDPKYKILRSPFHSSQGPKLHTEPFGAHSTLWAGRSWDNWELNYYGVRASLYPLVKDLEPNWFEVPERKEEIHKLFEKLILQSDTPNSLAATALVTDAYLYTGDEKYKKWVLEYTEAWMDRAKKNGGIMPDNVGPTGKIGEHREGQWWGGMYGWNHYQGFSIMFHGLSIAAECALLLTGDFGYLDLLRDQIKVLLDASIKRDDGQLIMPTRYGPDGWQYDPPKARTTEGKITYRNVYTGPMPWRAQELVHLYHASMSQQDYDLIAQVRDGEVERDWNDVSERGGEKNGGDTELARFQYYDGQNPDWPKKILSAEYGWALETFEEIRADNRTVEEMISTNSFPQHPVLTKGLTQVTMGTPQSVYNGGLLRATVRYFDQDQGRPGLPKDVAALVDELKPDKAGIQLVNVNPDETRRLIVQAGAFGEHQFTEVRFQEDESDRTAAINGKAFAVELPPSTSIRIEVGMKRFANDPSYAFPWHGDKIPVPFQ